MGPLTATEEDVVLTLTEDQLFAVMSVSATFTLIEDAAQNLESVPIDDEELAALRLLPDLYRMKITARLVEIAEVLREALREIDGRVLELTAGQQDS